MKSIKLSATVIAEVRPFTFSLLSSFWIHNCNPAIKFLSFSSSLILPTSSIRDWKLFTYSLTESVCFKCLKKSLASHWTSHSKDRLRSSCFISGQSVIGWREESSTLGLYHSFISHTRYIEVMLTLSAPGICASPKYC